jgi:GntR family transcriptional regulator
MDFVIDRAAEVPIGVQLAWAIRAGVDAGRLAPGLRLPGLRDLAQALAINPNTVRSVYARLEREGLLESRQGSGTFVAADVTEARSQASTIAADAAREAMRSGVDPREVAAALYVDAERPAQRPRAGNVKAERGADAESAPATEEIARRASLRAQIAALEQALGELEAEYPSLVQSRATVDGGAKRRRETAAARLPSAAELERTRLTLLRRLASLQATIDGLRQAAGA